MYTMTNGVKQGELLYPLLFTIYIVGLYYELKRAGVRFHINGEFAGAFWYADDSVLLYALTHYITVCEETFKGLIYSLKLKCFNVKNKDLVLFLFNQPVIIVDHDILRK